MPVFTAAVMSAGQLELEAQQIRLRSQAPGVANEVSVAAQDAVTGDDDGDGIGAVRGRNRTDGVGVAQTLGQLEVGDGRTERYLPQSVPHPLLKCRSDQAQRQVESLPRAAEVLAELFPGGAQQVSVFLDVVGIEFTPDTRIDGGAPGVYKKTLKPRLMQLSDEERKFELLVVTHIDYDHIRGIIELALDDKLPFKAKDVWFNGFRHIPDKPEDVLAGKHGEQLTDLAARVGQLVLE